MDIPDEESHEEEGKRNHIQGIGLDKKALLLEHVEKILTKGWASRISDFNLLLPESLSLNSYDLEKGYTWSLDSKMPISSDSVRIIVNVNVQTDHWKKMLEQGPPAQDPLVPSFVEFWGDKYSGLRRFKDGQILHCGVWGENDSKLSSYVYRHLIIMNMGQYLLKRHLQISEDDMELVTAFMDKALLVDKKKKVHSQDVHEEINRHWNGLHSIINTLELEHIVKDARAVGPSIVGTNPSPQLPNPILKNAFLASEPKHHKYSRLCPEPIDVVLRLESYNNWSDDYVNIQDVKTAFYFDMKKAFLQQYNLKSTVTREYIDVYYSGYVWRIYIKYHREIELARRNGL